MSDVSQEKISFEQFKEVVMTVGEILDIEPVPETDKLLRLSVDLGENEPRQIVSGIAPFFPDIAVLRGKKCVFATNIAPRTIRGFKSDGMILAAHTDDGTFALMVPERDVPAGTLIG